MSLSLVAKTGSEPAEYRTPKHTASDGEFDNILTIAAGLCGAPAAHLIVVDDAGPTLLASSTLSADIDDGFYALCIEAVNRRLALVFPDHVRSAGGQRHDPVSMPRRRSHVVVPVRLPDGRVTGTILVQAAITDRAGRKTLAMLQALASEAAGKIESARLAALRRNAVESRARFADMILHDAKGVLRCVDWMLERIEAHGAPNPAPSALARASITELMRSLEDLGRIQHEGLSDFVPSVEAHDLGRWFDAFCRRERIRADRSGVELRAVNRLQDTVFPTDLRLLQRIAGNLCANAVAASAPGSTVTIRLAADRTRGLELVVEDEGPGIPDDYLPDVFDPYFTRGKAAGTGLGLSICRNAATKLGGRLEYERRSPTGSRFRFAVDHVPTCRPGRSRMQGPSDAVLSGSLLHLASVDGNGQGQDRRFFPLAEPGGLRLRTASLSLALSRRERPRGRHANWPQRSAVDSLSLIATSGAPVTDLRLRDRA